MRFLFIFLLFLSSPVYAAGNAPLSFDLETDHIDITTGFGGKNLIVFGAKDGSGDVRIIVEGPRSDMVVRKKGRIFGAWLNKKSATFKNLPVFYDVAGGGDGAGVDFPFMNFEEKGFKEGFVRNKQAQGLYPRSVRSIAFIDDHLFRTSFYIPSNVPVGEYTVRVIYTKGAVVQEKSKAFRVAQVGVSARIEGFSRNYSLFYGILCVSLAVFAGWFSNRVRRRL